jgi:hypothetical protein
VRASARQLATTREARLTRRPFADNFPSLRYLHNREKRKAIAARPAAPVDHRRNPFVLRILNFKSFQLTILQRMMAFPSPAIPMERGI